MLLTDPPYGTTRNPWDVPLPLPEFWEAVRWAVKPDGAILLFSQCPYDKVLGSSNLKMLRYEWIWVKENGTGFLNARRAPLKKTEKRIETAEQLSMQYDAIQAEIDALTDRRSTLYKIRRSGHGGDAISEEIANLTAQLRTLRRELKLCVRIEGDIPKVETAVRQTSKEHSQKKSREKADRSQEQQSKIER